MTAHTPAQVSDWIALPEASPNDESWVVAYRAQPSIAIFSGLNERCARLIAAAPDMLAVLKWLDQLGGLGIDKHERIQAAITKAEGRT